MKSASIFANRPAFSAGKRFAKTAKCPVRLIIGHYHFHLRIDILIFHMPIHPYPYQAYYDLLHMIVLQSLHRLDVLFSVQYSF